MTVKKVVFLTGTRADFGHIKGLISKLEKSKDFEPYIFVTGMHMLSKYGSTYVEVVNQKYKHIHPYVNQTEHTDLDIILSNTVVGFSNYIKEIKPDLLIVHGDRVEALAGAIVGSFNNILTAHIAGGELTGTIDEFMRHAITKMCHIHFVANQQAKERLLRMGEKKSTIFVIGSPEIDLMLSNNLPLLSEAKKQYKISFDKYSIFIYHPVTTEVDNLKRDIRHVVRALLNTKFNYIVIYPNNDPGSDIIMDELDCLRSLERFKLLPSIQFEYFLTLLKNCKFIIGNSSCGVREAPIYGIPSIDIGTRQKNRSNAVSVFNVVPREDFIRHNIEFLKGQKFKPSYEFGTGNSTQLFYNILKQKSFWKTSIQKQFVD